MEHSKHHPTSLAIPLAAIEEADHTRVGGKAASLAAMTAAQLPVPPGVVLTTAALETYLDAAGLAEELTWLRQSLQAEAAPTSAELAARAARVREGQLPVAVQDALRQSLAAGGLTGAGAAALAVRSSGTMEDMEGASFAGLYETVLNVRGDAALSAAVRRCWASLWSERVVDYARRKGLSGEALGMSVVVQQMVDARTAGVLFTVNPVTRADTEALVEAVFGLGEALVSGRVNADRFVLDLRGGEVVDRQIGEQELKIVPGEGGVREVPLDAKQGGMSCLSDGELERLIEAARQVQEHYGRPMDVELAFDGEGRMWLVQARPITTLTFAPEMGEWTTADFKDGGVSSAVCSCFMASLYEYAFDGSLPEYFKSLGMLPPDYEGRWCRTFFARPYWNLGEAKQAVEKIPGYNEESFDADLGISAKPGTPSKTTPTSLRTVLGALPVLFKLKRSYRERLAIDERYVAAFEERKAPFDLDADELAGLSREDFARRYRELVEEFYFETETTYFYTIYNTSNAKTDFKPVFDRVDHAAGGGMDYLELLSGLKDLSHVRVMKDMHGVVGGLAASGRALDDATVAAFARKWRHHSRKELDIRVPRWEDDLPHVREFLQRNLAEHDAERDPTALEQAQHERYLKARATALGALRYRPLLRRSFRKKLELVRTYEWWREEMRDYSSYLYYLIRKWTVESARRLAADGVLDAPEDVWHLRFAAVIAALAGEVTAEQTRADVAWGRWYERSFRNFENPNEVGCRYAFDGAEPVASVDGGELHGIPCSVGQTSGPAKVARTLEEAADVAPGSVLVARFTDPGWTPLFARLAGVVTETGGVLSHAAVISREYGIPAVLAVPGATRAIKDGDTVALDGAAGTVIVTERAAR